MSSLSRDELSILNMYKNEIQYVPTRETLMKYHKFKYDPFAQYNLAKDKESKRREKTDDGYEQIGDAYKGFMLSRALKPSHSGLTVEELERAQLTRAARNYYQSGEGAAEQYLSQKNSPFTLDKDLSNNEGIVVVNNKTGKPEIAYRGTDKFNLDDIKTDAAILVGKEADTEQFKNADNQIQSVKEKYGILPDHYNGFSLGGSKGLHFGQKYNTRSTNFNPFMGKNLTNNISQTTSKQRVIRTTEDPISLGLALSDNATHDSWEIKSILPLKKNSLNPISAHNLENFTNEDNLGREQGNAHEYMEKNIDTGIKLAEYEDLHSAVDFVNEGKTYADWLRNGQTSTRDTYIKSNGEIGLKGNRHIPKSRGMRAWHDAGGSFTGDEAVYIQQLMNNKIPTQPADTPRMIGAGEGGVKSVPLLGPEEPKTQKIQSTFRNEKSKSILLPETKLKMLMARGGIPEINEEGYVTGLYGEQKFIQPEKRADYNQMREQFNKAQGIVKDVKFQSNIQKRLDKVKGIDKTPIKMSDDELDNRNDIIDKQIETEHKNNKYGLSQDERQTFVLEDKEDRNNIIEDSRKQMEIEGNTTDRLLGDPMEAAGIHENFVRSIHPTNLATGFIAGAAVEKAAKFTGLNKAPLVPRDLIKGAATGGLTAMTAAGLTGRALTMAGAAPEIAAGGISYLAADLTKMGLEKGIQKLGGNKDTQESIGDIGGGIVGGATFGGMVGGPEGAAIGAGIGAIGGAAGYGLEKLGASSKTAKTGEEAVEAGLAGAGVGAAIGSVIPILGTGAGALIGGGIAEGAYWISKLF